MARRRREHGQAHLEVNLTPLLDVVLQLITFFMMLVHYGTRIDAAEVQVRLPRAPAALPGQELAADRLVVAIDAAGALRVEGQALGPSAAEAWWAEQAKHRREGLESLGRSSDELATLVIVRADAEARYGDVRRLLAAAQDQGFSHFTLVVLRERQP